MSALESATLISEAGVADVNIQQAPPEAPRGGGGGGSGAGWAVAIVLILGIVAWLVFGGGLHKTSTYRADVKIETPGSAPSKGSAGGNVASPSANPAPSGGSQASSGGSAAPPKNP